MNSFDKCLVIVPQLRHDNRPIGHRADDAYELEERFHVVTRLERLIEYGRQLSVEFLHLRNFYIFNCTSRI